MTITGLISRPEPPAATGAITARKPTGSSKKWNWILLGLVAVLGIILPFILSAAELGIGMRVIIFALLGIGWNLMSGFGGMFSFGHAAYFGIGAYTTGFLLVDFGVSPWIGMLAGIAVASISAVGISYLALRYKLRGAYYALSTFAFAEMLRLFTTGNETLNRTVGFTVPVLREDSWVMFQFRAGSPIYFWIGSALLIAALLISIVFLKSRPGRFTIAVRDDEVSAASVGIPVLAHKLGVVALSAAITSIAGTLYFQYYMFIDPDLAFGFAQSNNAIITAVVGGVGTVWGPLLGALIVGPLSDLVGGLQRQPPEWLSFLSGHSGLDNIIFAAILIGFVILLPKGIVGTFLSRRKK